jgi:D-alanine-D-alanine ligase
VSQSAATPSHPASSTRPTHVLVLGGGPDAERDVSLVSSKSVAEAITSLGTLDVTYKIIDRPTEDDLAAMPGDVIFPVLHGPWGEGGPMQDLLEDDGRPYVGSRPAAARLAMDKLGTKLAAASAGVLTARAGSLNLADDGCPLDPPLVIKPVHEGSSVGVHIVRDHEQLASALTAARADIAVHPRRVYMVEQLIEGAGRGGHEVTVGVLDGAALAVVEIKPASEFYDYHAKYHSDDTRYIPDPPLKSTLKQALMRDAETMARVLGVRHLCRVDFIIDPQDQHWLLEVNTMPGFTPHSLLPMAAAHRGISFAQLAGRLVELAVAGQAGQASHSGHAAQGR